MKNSKNFLAKTVKSVAEHALKRDANSTTCLAIYQPKVPTKLILFKEKKNAD